MTDRRVAFRGRQVIPAWPEQVRVAQQITACRPNGVAVPRVRYGEGAEDWGASSHPCRDGAAAAGKFHVPGCDIERCPACGGQMLGCECRYPDDEE